LVWTSGLASEANEPMPAVAAWCRMTCKAGGRVLQEGWNHLGIERRNYNSCGLQWLAFLPPQHTIQAPWFGPEDWLLRQDSHCQPWSPGAERHVRRVVECCKTVGTSLHSTSFIRSSRGFKAIVLLVLWCLVSLRKRNCEWEISRSLEDVQFLIVLSV